MNSIIRVDKLEKSFKDKKALDGITFNVYEGEILCFLGPNGAGKSTTINILTTALDSDGGDIYFNDRKVIRNNREYKSFLGIVPQDLAIYEEISAERNVAFFAALYGLKGNELKTKVDEALKFVGLLDKKRDKVKTFSGGMKRRLNIACAIAHNPKIIIMDEPTVGIDPQSRNHILNSIKELRKQGATIIYTTHYMEEVEEISTRIIIVDNGKLIAEGTKEELKEKLADEKLFTVEIEDGKSFDCQKLYKIEGTKNVELKEGLLKISVLKGIENLDKIIAMLIGNAVKIKNITSEAESLEMVFLKLTGRTLRD
ncbi:MAG: ABC transporter ATP-binding protein [Bacillota bacterium]|nr:ABC transporter ATP-binding protein [Bacillota bacterium]